MQPSQLQAAHFAAYPPAARDLALQNLVLLRRMPLAFLPLLLREMIGFDWKFPAEKAELLSQFRFLTDLNGAEFDREMAPFAAIRLTSDLEASDWVGEPADFSEKLSAHLWSTHQIEAFRTASVTYVDKMNAFRGEQRPETARFIAVILGPHLKAADYPLFRKLRRQGTYFSAVLAEGGRADVMKVLKERSAKQRMPYAHWHVDGGSGGAIDNVSCVSYGGLQVARDRLVTKMRQVMAPGGAGPEALRSMMARMAPQELGLPSGGADELLNRFQISLLTEGSGTQLFSTTFVQWAAREILRRAQPYTLVLNYAPRQREQSMQELLSGKQHSVEVDPAGSLIDADMGAYYTWLNARRLALSQDDYFLAWSEEGHDAVLVGPGLKKGHESHEAATLGQLLEKTGNVLSG